MVSDPGTAAEPIAGNEAPNVVLAGDATLLIESLRCMLAASCNLRPRVISKPKELSSFDPRSVKSERGSGNAVVVMVDPIELSWRDHAQLLRKRERGAALVVITTRPTYAIQRTWRKPLDAGGYVANALLSSRADEEVLLKAIGLAYDSPGSNTGMWLDDASAAGDKNWVVPPHPRRWYATEDGRLAADLARDVGSFEALLCEAYGLGRPEAASLLGIKEGEVKVRLNKAAAHLNAPNEVSLGCRAVQLGLLDDPPETVRQLFEELASRASQERAE